MTEEPSPCHRFASAVVLYASLPRKVKKQTLLQHHAIILSMTTRTRKPVGKVITPGDVNVWPHEELTAKALAKAGYTVEFIRRSN